MPAPLLTWALLLASPDPDLQPRIYGGDAVSGSELAQVVSISIGTRRCTGTVVAERLVLTAAHCLAGVSEPDEISVIIGASSSDPLATLGVTEFGVHPDFCGDLEDCGDLNDFAYLELDQPTMFTDGFVEPLATQGDFDLYMQKGQDVVLVGFGEDEDGTLGQKRKVTTSIREFSEGGGEFLAGGDGKDSCVGDSGGPALIVEDGELRLAGVLSRGYDCGEGGFYGIPYPVLCWLRDETGVDFADGCDSCDCIDLPAQPPEKRGCRVTAREDPSWPGLLALGVVGFALFRRRTGSQR